MRSQRDKYRSSDDRERARARLDKRMASQGSMHSGVSAGTRQHGKTMRPNASSLGSDVIWPLRSRTNFQVSIGILIAFLLAVFVLPSIFSCANEDVQDESIPSVEGVGGMQEDLPEPDEGYLKGILGTDLSERMLEIADYDEDVRWLASFPDSVKADGSEAQRKLLTLAVEEPAARRFVRDYGESYPADGPSEEIPDADDGEGAEKVPMLFQWDPRWGYTEYSGAAFAQTGCGPSCFSIVYQGLTGETDMTPYEMGVLADENGFMSEENGTYADFFTACSAELGITAFKTFVERYALKVQLEQGNLLIANLGPGEFTEDGHFIVIAGIDDDGNLTIRDPYSKVRSERKWPADEILDQTIALYTFNI